MERWMDGLKNDCMEGWRDRWVIEWKDGYVIDGRTQHGLKWMRVA